jgi:hypothetical protein
MLEQLLHCSGKVSYCWNNRAWPLYGALRLYVSAFTSMSGQRAVPCQIEKMTGIRREARPRGRPRLEDAGAAAALLGQGELSLE